MGELRCC